jgi:hypothetical protein
MEADPVSETCFNFQEHRMMEKAQKSSNSICYTSSPEPIKIDKSCVAVPPGLAPPPPQAEVSVYVALLSCLNIFVHGLD